MTDLRVIRKWLNNSKGRWKPIAEHTGLSRRIISKIAGNEDYLPSLRTMLKLIEAKKKL